MIRVVTLPAPELDASTLGGKGAGLSRLLAERLPVPPAVVLPVEVFHAALEGAPAGGEARWLSESALPAPVLAAIDEARLRLGAVPLAVRSSALGEDGDAASFAGAHETVLDVRSSDELVRAVRHCWASAFSERARAYRSERGGGSRPSMAVVVQHFIEPDFAGVAFTADPVSGARGVVIEAVAGRGDALVSGRVAPQRVRAGDEGSAPFEPLAKLAREVEARLGDPQDLEWAMRGGEVFLLQARPITTLAKKKRTPIWSNTNAAEVLPGVLTPMSVSIAKLYVRSLLRPVLGPFGLDSDRLEVVGRVAGRLYFNLHAIMAWMSSFPGVRADDATVWARLLGGSGAAIASALAKLEPHELPRALVSRWRALRGLLATVWMAVRHHRGDASEALAAVAREADVLEAVNEQALDDAALLAHVESALAGAFGTTDAVIACAGVGMGSLEALRRLCAAWFDDRDGALAGRLMTGIGGFASADAGLAIDRLAEKARSLGVAACFSGAEPWAQLEERLRGAVNGPAFLAEWSHFMAKHGHHARGESDVASPRWREQPDVVLAAVRAALTSTGPGLAAREQQRQAERARLVSDLLARVGPIRRAIFRAVLRRVDAGLSARENGRSEAVRRIAIARRSLLELGARLVAAGELAAPEDVLMLSLEELSDVALRLRSETVKKSLHRERKLSPERSRRAASHSGPSTPLRDEVLFAGAFLHGLSGSSGSTGVQTALRAIADRRRAELVRWKALTPPGVVMGEFDPREAIAPPAPSGSLTLTGIAASPGVVEGVARVLVEPGPGDAIQPGEILVAPFTDPGWTPLFINAAALVTDFGGLLSHGSVVAREYGLPAVVNAGNATLTIRTGQRVRVDGNRGEVVILGERPRP